MIKQLIPLLSFCLLVTLANAQTIESVYDDYLNFNLARLQGEKERLPPLIARLIPNADKLPDKSRTNFYYAIGKIYEDRRDYKNAEVYYLKVAQLQPDYYVVQRGLGYIYFDRLKDIEAQLNAEKTDWSRNQQLFDRYIAAAKKTLPYLEKAEACDPDPNTHSIITLLYMNIKDTKGLDSLDERLKLLRNHCVDLLPE